MTLIKISIYLTFLLVFLKLVDILPVSWVWVIFPIWFLVATIFVLMILGLTILTLTIKIIKKTIQ
jgi:hypothetical protein